MNHLLACLIFGILADFAIAQSFWRSHQEYAIVEAVSLSSSCATIDLISFEIKTLNFERIASVDEESTATNCSQLYCESSMNFTVQA
jgi:spore coat protein U-like protein